MFKNYLTIAWRNLIKDKTFSIINVVGLSMAFGVVILLSMEVLFEFSYDNFHKNNSRIYEVYKEQQTVKGQQAGTTQPTPFAPALKAEVPGIDKITRVLQDGVLVINGEKEISLNAIWVDPDFFSMFTFLAKNGNTNNVLLDLSSVVITKDAANKLFGETNVVGETFTILQDGKEKPFTVTAVIENIPVNSSIEFDIAIRFENNREYAETLNTWDSQYHQVYVQLQNDISAIKFSKSTQAFVKLHYQGTIESLKRDGAVANENGEFIDLRLLPLKDVHFTSFIRGFADVNRTMPYVILGIAMLILFIACVNFINMSIAKSVQRLKEIGMRKTLGANKKQIFFQFWFESLLVFLLSLVVGIILSVLLLDDFKTIFRTSVSFDVFKTPLISIGLLGVMLCITVLAGGYPAILLTRLGAIQSLKGKLETTGKNRVRDVLIVIQFAIAILLITTSLVINSQVEFMRNKNLGYDKEQIISIPLNGKKNSYAVVKLLKQELRGNPDVVSVSGADNNLGRGKDGSLSSSVVGFEYKGRTVNTNFLVVDYEYIQTLGLNIVQGRNFKSSADSLGVVINQAMARELGEKDPLLAQLEIRNGVYYPVFGVVKDYHFQELDRAIKPLTFFMSKDIDLTYAYVKVSPHNMAKTFDVVAETWKKIEPNAEFLGSFLDENIDRTFRREKSMSALTMSGSIIAIVISCIGLFAMSMLIVSQRKKEIGIRKVLGASVFSVTYLLTKDFLILVLVAFLIASPIAWWLMKSWLQNYAYRIDLSAWYFIVSGLLAVFISLFTISTRTIKAAITKPVKNLRDE
ncbi:ABC transporter permease [Yeosuana marina]|uniref:ABC transporter permease n=1 Tax=Yeosuana marina TaxID=1565536 RepID=UPI001422C9DB|nr:ABC transporter permease [Yeosuana marina]